MHTTTTNTHDIITLSPDTGIVVCLLVWSHHACRTESEAMTEHFYRLREYALQHAEYRAIMSIID